MKPFLAMAVLAFALPPRHASSQTQSPYVAFQGRPIKSLFGQQIGDLRTGRGMGLALGRGPSRDRGAAAIRHRHEGWLAIRYRRHLGEREGAKFGWVDSYICNHLRRRQ